MRGSGHWNRTSPIGPYEGPAQTIYARPPLATVQGVEPRLAVLETAVLP